MKVLLFKDMSFSMPINDGETPEEIEDRVIDILDSLRDDMVIGYKAEIEEWDDD
jgi:hypothetical protein